MIKGFNHTSFTVPDIERAVRFWCDTLGFEGPPIAERTLPWVEKVTGVLGARIKVAHLFGYGHHMEFIEYADGPRKRFTDLPDRPGVAHVCLEVGDIHGTYRTLLAAGASPLGEMMEIRDPNIKACSAGYVRDPNGIIIELLELADGSEDRILSSPFSPFR
jgi:catechol 2,3-dioxygenase-like lactoylglutathione lyase family enzyme